MNPDHIAEWRDCLAGQMHEQHGVAEQEAQKTAARWPRSLVARGAIAPEAYQIPESARVRNERRGLLTGRGSILLLLCTGLFGMSTSGATLYAVLAGSPNIFGTVDTITGVFDPIGPETHTLFGMGFAPNGTLYGTDDSNPAEVYQVDPFSGIPTDLGHSSDSAIGSTVGSDGLLYAVDQNGPGAAFYTIDPNTLAVHVINPDLGFISDGLAVFANGIFYTDALIGGTDVLEAVDPGTGHATAIGSGFDVGIFAGANVDGTIYAGSNTGYLYTIDTATGAAAQAFKITGGSGDVDALAFNSAPEPSTSVLASLGIALAGLVSAIRRSRRASSRI